MVGTLRDPSFDRDIWLVPVGINYDRVLEDRSLIRERVIGGRRPSLVSQFFGVASYLFWNTARFFTGRLRRYGRAAVNFGTPLSVRTWLRAQPAGILELPRYERLAQVQRLADDALEQIGLVIPVTPVPLAAAALLSFGASVVTQRDLLDRIDDIRDQLDDLNAKVVRKELPVTEIWERAWLMFRMRRMVLREGETLIIPPQQRPLLEYYANSIRHLLPVEIAGRPFPRPARAIRPCRGWRPGTKWISWRRERPVAREKGPGALSLGRGPRRFLRRRASHQVHGLSYCLPPTVPPDAPSCR